MQPSPHCVLQLVVAFIAMASTGASMLSASERVFGRVVAESGEAVANSRLVLRDAVAPHGGSNLAETLSDAEGNFSFSAQDQAREHATSPRLQLVAIAPGMGVEVIALTGDPHASVEVTLKPEAIVEGTFVDATGAPQAGVIVHITAISPHSWPELASEKNAVLAQFLEPTITGQAGVAKLRGVPREHFCRLRPLHPQAVYETLDLSTHRKAAQQAADKHGELVDRAASPTFGATFTAEPGPGQTMAQLEAEMRQQFNGELLSLMESQRELGSDPQTENILRLTGETGVAPGNESVAATEQVTGQVVELGTDRGIAGIGVTYLLKGEPEHVMHQLARRTQTDEQGRFTLQTPPGELTVRLYRDFNAPHPKFDIPEHNRWDQGVGISAGSFAKTNVIAGQKSSPLKLSANTGLTIRGSVVDSEGRPVPEALADVAVDIYLPAGIAKLDYGTGYGWSRFWLTANKEGKFEMNALPPHARISMTVKDLSGTRLATLRIPPDFASPGPRTLELPPIVLAETVSVSGKLLVDGKPPAKGSEVELETLGEALDATDKPKRDFSATTDSEGGFVIERVIVGLPYTLRCNTTFPDDEIVSQATTEEVFPPLQPGQEFEMGTISLRSTSAPVAGTAVDAAGRPLANVLIEARLPDGRPCAEDYMLHLTGPDGRFRLTQLEGGPVTLHALQFPPPQAVDRTPVARAKLTVTAPAARVRLELK